MNLLLQNVYVRNGITKSPTFHHSHSPDIDVPVDPVGLLPDPLGLVVEGVLDNLAGAVAQSDDHASNEDYPRFIFV